MDLLRIQLVCLLFLAGCQTAEQASIKNSIMPFEPVTSPQVTPVAWDQEPAQPASLETDSFAGVHTVEEYLTFALPQNPSIQAARKRMQAASHQIRVARGLQDPTLKATIFPEEVQTAAGQQKLILAMSQKIPGFGKREARACKEKSSVKIQQAKLTAAELTTIERVKLAYYELYYIQQATLVTKTEQKLLENILESATARYESGKATQQDVLLADLEITNIENKLIRLKQQHKSGQARLCRVLHISSQTEVLPAEHLAAVMIPGDLDWLQAQATTANPELHAQLFEIQREQRLVRLEKLNYRPDLTVGMAWIGVDKSGISPVANGRDSVLLSAGINLPIYRERLAASVRSAQAKSVAASFQYESILDQTLESVTDLHAKVTSQQELLALLEEEIIPKARQTLEVSNEGYNVGKVGFLQLLDNWRQLLRYQLNYHRLEASLRQTHAQLERVVGGYPQAVLLATPPAVLPVVLLVK